jgi:dephospho-CoA kinase
VRVVGLTGGVAAGKSTASAWFRAQGIAVIDADQAARDVLAPGTPALAEVVAAFGIQVLDPAGALDRPAMRARVFADAAARRRLEAITHPRIRDLLSERLAAAPGPYVVLDVPLLIESPPLRALAERILVIDVPEEVQLQRLIARDGMDLPGAQAMLDAQAPRAVRLAAAHDVVDNSGPREALAGQLARLHARYLELARERPAR